MQPLGGMMYKDCLRLLAAFAVVALIGTNLLAADGPASDVDLRLPPPDLFDIGWPTWTPHGVPLDTPWTLYNWGDTDLAITITPVQDNGPTGWLTISSELQGTVVIPSGENNSVTGTITLNTGGVVNAPGTIVYLRGRLDLDPDGYGYGPDPLEVECWVADTVYLPAYDTITTGCLSLVIRSSGNYGNQGAGRVNMDFLEYGDCDSLAGAEDTIPGRTEVYIYDASPVICWPDGDSVVCNWSIFGWGMTNRSGFIPMGYEPPVDSGDYKVYQSQFVAHDTSVLITRKWIVPQPAYDSCTFLIQATEYRSADGQTHSGLTIGEAIDWDIPADTVFRNRSGYDLSNGLIWQNGSEYNDDDDVECQENSDRYGGIAMLEVIEIESDDTTCNAEFYGAYTEDNYAWVYPAGGFVPEELDSMMTANAGYVLESDSLDTDLHTVMTFRSNYTLTPDKTLIVFSCLISGRLGYADFISSAAACRQWYMSFMSPDPADCCMGPIRGNVDYDPEDNMDISDLMYLVEYMFTGGPAPLCWLEADVDGSGGSSSGSEDIDISDLVMLVNFMFTGGDPPAACP
ncbi:MAG: hypothetical protein KAW61_08885 [candidate division Zixibacteria bacterium]|nr:hypothetical protein [candidate division Zixibacteria bacterium]